MYPVISPDKTTETLLPFVAVESAMPIKAVLLVEIAETVPSEFNVRGFPVVIEPLATKVITNFLV